MEKTRNNGVKPFTTVRIDGKSRKQSLAVWELAILLTLTLTWLITGCGAVQPISDSEKGIPQAETAADNTAEQEPSKYAAANFKDGKYRNSIKLQAPGFTKSIRIIGRYLTQKRIDRRPETPLPLQPLTRESLDALANNELYLVKLGHSSILIKNEGKYWLLDPVFAQRASPVSFAGPKRFQPTPIKLQDLPPIEKVILSHDHYDHLDKSVIQYLAATETRFLVPLGVDTTLQKWGVDPARIVSFDWWQELQTGAVKMVFTPAQHFSGRGLTNRNRTLWGSWVIKTPTYSLFFSGDSGYFDGFRKIGDRYGPFHLTFMENGAYNANWPDNHMLPEETVQAHLDLRGDIMIPMHNATFDLSFHSWYDPLERVSAEAERLQVKLTTPYFGQIFTPTTPPLTDRWWQRR